VGLFWRSGFVLEEGLGGRGGTRILPQRRNGGGRGAGGGGKGWMGKGRGIGRMEYSREIVVC
jgi:hypothetical protein